jgi:TPP-dependent pyruvate/acetoin dehydrogenase alpha subunit
MATRARRQTATDQLLELYTTMTRIRAFEERVAKHFRAGDVHGFVHVSIGQEAVAAGACAALAPDDLITTTHRGHGHCLAKGADPEGMMAELFGRATGLGRGKGGSMHLADARLGILGANGIVGAGIPLATGAALAAQVRRSGQVAVAFFGEGALHTGAFHEAASLAVAWQLPLILLCERNGYAEFTPTAAWGGPEPAERATSYHLTSEIVDGSDVVAVRSAVQKAAGEAREGGGPRFIEAQTTRLGGHYEGDAQPYRDPQELEAWKERDPLLRTRGQLSDEQAEAADSAAAAEMDAAVEAALAAPYPTSEAALEDVHG